MNVMGDQFNALITQYQDTYQEFVKNLQTTDNNDGTSTSEWMLAPNVSYTGATTLDATENSTEEQCMTACSENAECGGATFDKMRGTCTLSGSGGSLVSSTDQTAVVKRGLYYSTQLKTLNQALMNLNRQMMENANRRMNDFSQSQEHKDERVDILERNYATLQDEEGKIQALVREYETLNSAYENGSISLTSRYYSYLVYVFILLLVVGVLIKVGADMTRNASSAGIQMGGGAKKGGWLALVGVMAGIVVINAVVKTRDVSISQ